MLNYIAIWTLNREYHPERLEASAHPTLVPAQVFRTKDSYVVVLCFKEKFWQALSEVLQAPDLASDPRYASFAKRYEHRETLIADLRNRFLERTTGEWLELLTGRVPCAPVNSVEDALREEQVLARDMLVEVEHPTFGRLREVRMAIKMQGMAHQAEPAPAPGASTKEILTSILGYSAERISTLHQRGAICPHSPT
jgi:crotonobetainyl-CoA:carnitine CoA-transferase CaiB-like acyl-CoA transferase